MIHHVFANRSNIGDWLSAIGIQRLLAPHTVREHLCDAPFVRDTLERLGAAEPNDLVLVGGGGLFMDYFEPLWQGLLPIAERVPLAIWGVGYCDLKKEPTRCDEALLNRIVTRSRLCIVRDEMTRKHLRQCELPPPVQCPATCAVETTPGSGLGVLHVNNYTTVGAEAFEVMDAVGKEWAHSTGRAYRTTNNRIDPGDRKSLDRILHLYRLSDVILSSALHGCIIAAALGRKVIAVSGDRKIEAFMEWCGLSRWVIDADRTDSLAACFASIHEQPPVVPALDSARLANRRVARQLLDSLTSC